MFVANLATKVHNFCLSPKKYNRKELYEQSFLILGHEYSYWSAINSKQILNEICIVC